MKNLNYYNYHWTKRVFLAIIIAMLLLAGTVYAQVTDSYTNNLINNTTNPTTAVSTWQNAGTINQPITCWAPGDKGYCGPLPYVNGFGNNNSINFSYGMTEIYQMVNVGKALPNGGAGLVNTGYVFSFLAKNGNGWDDGRQDYLKAQVTLYGPNNAKVLEQHSYDLNSVFNWTNFSYNANWNTTKVGYRENQVGNVKFGFYGMDNNYWAGPYGPEITDINFRLKYRPDPCVKNPLFSPECPNFQQELNKSKTTVTSSESLSSTVESQPTQFNNYDGAKKESSFNMGEKEEGVFKPEEERLGEPSNGKLDTLEFALIKIFDAQEKQEEKSIEIANSAVEKSEQQTKEIVRNAEQKVREVVNQQFKEFETIKQQSMVEQTRENITISDSIFKGPENSSSVATFQLQANQNNNVITILQDNKPQNNTITQQFNTTRTNQNFSLQMIREQNKENTSVFGTVNDSQVLPTVAIYAPLQSTNIVPQQTQQTVNTNVEVIVQPVLLLPKVEPQSNLVASLPSISITPPMVEQFQPLKQNQNIESAPLTTNFLTNKSDPINEILEQKNNFQVENKVEEKTQSVKSNVQDNEAAGGVTLTQLAVAPIGYNQYINFVLKDAAFYTPKEIYRGQKTIDNARALRQLASDRLHQEMVDQQYRR